MSLPASQESGPSRAGGEAFIIVVPPVPSLRVEMADLQLGPEQCSLGRLPVELGLEQGPSWPAGVCLHVPVQRWTSCPPLYSEQTPILVERFYYRCPILSTLGTR